MDLISNSHSLNRYHCFLPQETPAVQISVVTYAVRVWGVPSSLGHFPQIGPSEGSCCIEQCPQFEKNAPGQCAWSSWCAHSLSSPAYHPPGPPTLLISK